MLWKAKASTSINVLITEKMSTSAAPLAIGTRGTVGSLVRREIEYFRRIELDHGETSKKPKPKSSVGFSSPSKTRTFGSLMSWRSKKRRPSSCNSNTSSFLPSMCSAVEVSESKRFSYRVLKSDVQNIH